jgi:hypothetical protein
MSREEEAKQARLFDTRIVERNIRKGLITRKDYEKHLKALSDAAEKVAPPEAPRAAVPIAPISVSMGAASDEDLDDSDTEEVTLDDDDVEDDDEDEDDDAVEAEGDDGGGEAGGGDRNNVPS